jgi:hypothetical protein
MPASGNGKLSDLSSTIATGGTAQSLSAANENRRGYSVMNLSTGKLYVNDVGGTAVSTEAGASITINAGDLYESPRDQRPTSAISILGATTGQAFAAREW